MLSEHIKSNIFFYVIIFSTHWLVKVETHPIKAKDRDDQDICFERRVWNRRKSKIETE